MNSKVSGMISGAVIFATGYFLGNIFGTLKGFTTGVEIGYAACNKKMAKKEDETNDD